MKTNLFHRTYLPVALILMAAGDAMSCRLVNNFGPMQQWNAETGRPAP